MMEPVDALYTLNKTPSFITLLDTPFSKKIMMRPVNPAPCNKNAMDSSLYYYSRLFYRPTMQYPKIEQTNREIQTDIQTHSNSSLSDEAGLQLNGYLSLSNLKARTLSTNPTKGEFQMRKKRRVTSSPFGDMTRMILEEQYLEVDLNSDWICYRIPRHVPETSRKFTKRVKRYSPKPRTNKERIKLRYKNMIKCLKLTPTVNAQPIAIVCDQSSQTYCKERDEYPTLIVIRSSLTNKKTKSDGTKNKNNKSSPITKTAKTPVDFGVKKMNVKSRYMDFFKSAPKIVTHK